MAWNVEKESGDIVIDGWENGIASSPHKGIANIQNGNISTESGEVVASFVRSQQTLQSTATGTGTLTYRSTDHVNLAISGSNNLFKGLWITVTGSSNTTQLPNGTYYVPPSTGAGFQLANYYKVSATAAGSQNAQVLVIGGGGGGGSYTGSGTGGGGGGGAGGFTYTSSVSISPGINSVVVGAGGAHGDASSSYLGYSGSSSTFNTTTSNGGGGGGSNAAQAGAAGASGGGAGNSAGTLISGGAGTVGQGNNGGNSSTGTSGAGGGGGAGSAGSAGSAGPTGGNGGNGSSNSISGAAITYAGGGGGGSFTTGGSGGTGGGGAGSSGSGNGTNATANTGGGGGGAGRGASGSGFIGGNGASGIVIISYPTGVVTNPLTAGGTYTTSGGRDIFTFSTVGSFVFAPTYANIPAPTYILSGFTAGLTANFTVVHTLGNPIAKAIETYFNNGTTYYRYYILDNQNLVWVYDTFNETLYSSTDNVSWFLPDYQTNWCTSATGIAVIDGFLIAAAQSGVYGKAVVDLGGVNTQSTTWAVFAKNVPWSGGASNSPHFCYVGHQGRLYITDGSYIRSYFPDSTLIAGTNTSVTSDNVQSLASWTIDSSRTPAQGYAATASPISGDEPFTSDEKSLPVIFFSDGSLPTSINANQVYYLKRDGNDFTVYVDPSMNDVNNTVTFTGSPVSGATTATLTASWTYPTGYYYTAFFNAGGQEYRNVYFTNGSTAAVWSPALTVNTNSPNVIAYGILDISTGAVGTQYYATFAPIYSVASPYPESGTVGTSLSVLSSQRLALPNFEIAQCMTEIGNLIIIGCKSNTVYPWDQQSNLPTSIISLPESNVVSILTVNQVAYMFAGNQGNIYITDGSLASLALNLPDYVAGIPGSPGSYIESTYYWGDTMYLRGRVYFSVLDQNATKVGNCGGIWSFNPTQNYSIDQDTGTALRLEAKNSYNTYNGYDILLIPKILQDQESPLYWSAWNSDINTPTYGIDYSTNGTDSNFPTLVETDALTIGTMLSKKTYTQIEYKLSSPLDLTASVSAEYRVNTTDSWKSIPQFQMEGNRLSGVSPINFEKSQWLQFRITLTPATLSDDTNSFVRLKEVRIR